MRLSQGGDEEEGSIKRQLDACRSLCEARGWQVVREYQELDTSASRGDRPVFRDLLAAGHRFEHDVIVVWKMDRLARQVRDIDLVLEERSDGSKVGLSSVHEPEMDTTSPTGEAFIKIITVLASLESATIKLRVKAAIRQKAEAGEKPDGAYRPFGLTDDWKDVNPREVEALRHVADMVIERQPLTACAKWLVKHGFETHPSGRPWTADNVRMMLTNRRLLGERWHLGELVVPDAFPQLLTPTVFDLVEQALTDPGRYSGPKGDVSQLAGVLRCGKCGGTMRARRDRYVCRAKEGQCGGVSCNRFELDRYVQAKANEWSRRTLDMSYVDTSRAEIDRITERLAQAASMFRDGEIEVDEWRTVRDPLVAKRNELRLQLRAMDTPKLANSRAAIQAEFDAVYIAPVTKTWRGPVSWRTTFVPRGAAHPDLPTQWQDMGEMHDEDWELHGAWTVPFDGSKTGPFEVERL